MPPRKLLLCNKIEFSLIISTKGKYTAKGQQFSFLTFSHQSFHNNKQHYLQSVVYVNLAVYSTDFFAATLQYLGLK